MTHRIFDPISLRGVEMRNRIWVPPMCAFTIEEKDGVPRDWHLMHYGALAQGGAGLVTVEATGVVREGRISPQDLGLWNDTQRDALARVVTRMHEEGAKASIQLAHAGRKASTWQEWSARKVGNVPESESGWDTVAPSAVAFEGLQTPHALSVDEIRGVEKAFVAAARRAVDAGFDVVEIHGAHGYLGHEFLSPLSNLRTDEYGGSLENRARFLLETVDAVRAEIGEVTPIIVRLSATDWVENGWDLDETITLSGWLKQHGVDLISVSTGGNEAHPQIPVGPGYQLPFATAIKNAVDIPVGAVGMIDDAFQAEQIVALGQADVVFVGRQMLRDAKFPIRAARALRYNLDYRPKQYARAFLGWDR